MFLFFRRTICTISTSLAQAGPDTRSAADVCSSPPAVPTTHAAAPLPCWHLWQRFLKLHLQRWDCFPEEPCPPSPHLESKALKRNLNPTSTKCGASPECSWLRVPQIWARKARELMYLYSGSTVRMKCRPTLSMPYSLFTPHLWS